MPPTTSRAAVPSFANPLQLRRRARASLEPGAVTDSYRGDREAVLRFLNEALATELVCALRYRRHHFMARALASRRIAEEFLVHSDEELAHADLLADRIVQLGGEPDFSPGTFKERSPSACVPVNSLLEMINQNLVAERIAIDTYRDLVAYVGENDPTTRRMLEGILGVEEAHADELVDLLQDNKAS
ncbi:MAG TPA: ferritin-like domain-containing protein [Steroidobacteraceae bacterium]|jgi:bacterioferritin